MDLEIGSLLDGKVTGITKFGAFVVLPNGRTGMVHISEVAFAFVNDIRDLLSEGQEVKVKVMAIDKEGRVNLSIKAALTPPVKEPVAERVPAYAGTRTPRAKENLTFEDKLKQFMQDSQTKMSDLKSYEKRGSRRSGRGK